MPNKNANGSDTFAAALTEVSDRLTRLVQDEIELAKTEVAQKASSLARGAAAVAAGAVFGVFAVVFFLLTLAWVLDGIFVTGAGSLWLGFLIVFVVLLGLTVGAFLFAWNKLKVGAPTPKMAISEGKKIKDTVTAFGSDSPSLNGHGAVTSDSIATAISPAIAAAAATPAPVTPAPITGIAPFPARRPAPAPAPEPGPASAAVEPAPEPTPAAAELLPEPTPAAAELLPEPTPAAVEPTPEPAPVTPPPKPRMTRSLWTEPLPIVDPPASVDPPTFVSIPEGEAPPVAGGVDDAQYDVEPVPEDTPDSDSSSPGPEN